MRTAKTTTIALATVAALLGTAGAATAVATTSDDPGASTAAAPRHEAHKKHAPKKDGARKLCKRAPKTDKRIDRVLRRLDGNAARRGSTARLEKRAENAKKAGHTAVETYLNHRLDDRRALAPRLKDRQKDLAKVRAWCKNNDNGKTKKSDDS